MQTARLGEGLVVDGGEANPKSDGEGGLLGAEGHLVEDHGAEVALVLGGAAEVEELALRTPSTQGTVGRSVRLDVCEAAACGERVDVRKSGRAPPSRPPPRPAPPPASFFTCGGWGWF